MPSKKKPNPLEGLTAADFISQGPTLTMTLEWSNATGEPHKTVLRPKEFSTLSLGWGVANTRVEAPLNDPSNGGGTMFGEVMLGCNFTLVRSKELPRGGYVKPAKEDKDKDAGSSPARQVKSEAYVESSGDEAQEAPKQRRGKAKGGPSDDEREEEEGVGSGSMALAKIAQQKKGQALSSSRQPKASNSSKRDNVDPESSEDEYDKLQAKKKRKVNRSASGDKKKTGKDMLWQ